MLIRLLKDKEQGGAVKTTIKRRTGRATAWFKGNTIEVSEETGKKLIKAREAEEVVDAPTESVSEEK